MILAGQDVKKTLKIRFIDYDKGFPLEQRLVYKLVAKHFEIDQESEPDYIICGKIGLEHFRYQNAVKILFNGENVVPDFNLFDYAIGFDHMSFGDRYVRVPLYVTYEKDYDELERRKTKPDEAFLRRDFCSFVVSNGGGSPMRQKFFEALSRYKKVDSGGRWMNNVGGPVADKAAFLRSHKFNIAFENSSSSGYVTEKLMQALSAQTVPIYFGAPDVEKDFLSESFICVKDENDIDRAVQEIIRLDNDQYAYLEMVTAPCQASLRSEHIESLESFLLNVFNQPYTQAKRRLAYGAQYDVYSKIAIWAVRFSRLLAVSRIFRKLV